jgi:HlyD family secretion protein
VADKSSLLNQLRIDRSESAAVRRSPALWWTLAAATAIGGAALTAWHFSRSAAVPIRTAVAISPRNEPAPPGATSLLDASGYVVARRRATVASKVTGKVIETSLEEGQRVESGQIIARPDDSNAKAALAQSEAQVKQAEAVVSSAQTAYEDALPIFSAKRAELMSLCWRKLIQTAVLHASACFALLDAIQMADWRAARLLFDCMRLAQPD